ncbi:DM13 domain-containing protein [Microbacterium sp. X-17]|uniref:DM13 domain-containing protein n=1 Tax=Microbacterium sp. X-17 TaxID=3144404 RepID=UPI0031F50F1A
MRMKALLSGGTAAAALAIALTGCASASGGANAAGTAQATAAAPTSTVKLVGTFQGENGKNAVGTVTITGNTLALSGFSSDQGPDLHLYLTNGTTEADVTAGVEISSVSYNTASQTFTLPGGVDASKYTDLVEHCDKAKAVFGAAPLSR